MIASFPRLSFLVMAFLLTNVLLAPSPAAGQDKTESQKSDVTENKPDAQESVGEVSGEKPSEESTADNPDAKTQSESNDDETVQDEPPKPRRIDAPDQEKPKDADESSQTTKDSTGKSDTTAAEADEILKNGSFEVETDGEPENWVFSQINRDRGAVFKLDDDNPESGKVAGLVDTTKADLGRANGFVTLNQYPDSAKLRGKRIRFRAAVRTDELADNGRAQLWLRVDRPGPKSGTVVGAFDNMDDRPITSKDWKHYDIVVDVDEDAVALNVGLLVFGKAKVWIDDASIEIVDDQTKTTTMDSRGVSGSANAPPQPFFTGWLWLALIALVLFAVSQTKNSFAQRFALRFTIGYWLLYCFPTLIMGIVGGILETLNKFGVDVETAKERLGKFVAGEKYYTGEVVQWVAANLFKIEGKLVLPNGSGDTTFAYIRLLICFFGAVAIAIVWSTVYWRKVDQIWLRDLLRSYLRYVLALTMLGYGLHKAGFITTQFASGGVPSEFQLNRTYGESSPMGLLWTFMAASPAYTFFAGLGEVTGGILLIFRRTATLGALVVFGVMLNVVMMNFCYDVPVKQYSFHLLIMAVIILSPDVPRLANVLFWNRVAEPSALLIPPYTNRITIWIHHIVKAIVVFCAFGLPIYEHVKQEIEYEHPQAVDSEHLLLNRGYRWISEYPFNR